MAVDFVGGDMVKAFFSKGTGSFQQDVGAHDIGMDKGGAVQDGAVDVGFGGEVDDGIDFLDEGSGEGLIGDIAFDEAIPGVGGYIPEIRQIAGIGEQIEVDNLVLGIFRQDMADEM
jgi:hypothetical protein